MKIMNWISVDEDLINDLLEYMEAKEDADSDGGANKEMQLAMRIRKAMVIPSQTDWIPFDFSKSDNRPNEYGKYLICRKDGKIHWETWNGSGWAYNHNEVRFYAHITKPKLTR